MIVSTTIFTISRNVAFPRTLTVEKRKGSGNVFLDTHTIFYLEWQYQLRTVFETVQKFFEMKGEHDFFVSVNSLAVDGWSTSLPLFLLFASSFTGEELPANVFSTGCMYAPDGWISYGKFESVQAKIDTLEALSKSSRIENPLFLIPFSFYTYRHTYVTLYPVSSAFSALEKALPQTFQACKAKIKRLSSAAAQDDLQGVLDHSPKTGELLVLISADKSHQGEYLTTEVGGIPFIVEEVPSDHPVYLYFIRDSMVVFKHSHYSKDQALRVASHCEEVFHGPAKI